MNGDQRSIEGLLGDILDGLASSHRGAVRPDADKISASGADRVEMQVYPPAVYLQQVVRHLERASAEFGIAVGAQNIHQAPGGAFTGEISAEMVKDAGATHVLIGHSERRQLFAEVDDVVAEKFMAAQRAGLTAVLCLGETLAERESGRAEEIVLGQLNAIIQQAGVEALGSALLAYEPVWAIGSGFTASPEDAQQMHACIRGHVAALELGDVRGVGDAAVSEGLCILYGGSVKGENAPALFACDDVDGALIGGASLSASAFLDIWRAAVE